jgi:phosphatidylglycerophosphate synthase
MLAYAADLLTFSRLMAAGVLVWLGFVSGARSLQLAAFVVVLGWSTDQLDGLLARRAKRQTMLGSLEFPIDVVLYAAILAYLVLSGFLPVAPIVVLGALAAVLSLISQRKAVAVLCLRFIDLAALGIVFTHAPRIGLLLLAWLACLGVFYRKRIAVGVPEWLGQLAQLLRP